MVCSLTASMNDYMHVWSQPGRECFVKFLKLLEKRPVIGTDNLHNKCFEAKHKPGSIFRRKRGRGDEGVVRGVGTENNLFFTQAPFPFHFWRNRNLTIHPYWCTGVYRIQNRSRKYLQTCFSPMQVKRLDYSIEQGNITLGKRWSQFK